MVDQLKEIAREADLAELIADPREALDIEIKNWLDVSNNDHRALVAKEIIALANHGGGYLVIGFDEGTDGTFLPAKSLQQSLDHWSQDAIQSVVAKYCDPAIQCRVVHQTSESQGPFPIVVVPGGHKGPILAKSGSPDGKTLVPQRIYIRRPGPSSEEPKTAEEWRQLIDRFVQARQSDLVEAMRSIMAGIVPGQAQRTPTRIEELIEFEKTAVKRWETRTAALPPEATPKFPKGFYEFGFAIDGEFTTQSFVDLRRTIINAVRNHSGWPPFLTIDRDPFSPKAIDGAIEFWRGPEADGSMREPDHHDFWRIAPQGLLFTRRGFQEDGRRYGMMPGQFFDITTPTWRLGEAMLEANYIARALRGEGANLIYHCRWVGLAGRKLISRGNPNRILSDRNRKCEQATFESQGSVSISALPLSLPELVHGILVQLYELFDFFVLPKRLVEEELAMLLRNT